MNITLDDVHARSRRRLWLRFSAQLASGAFSTLSLYSVVGDDGSVPGVVAAFVVVSSQSAVELALDTDLVEGVAYTVSAVGVPDTDADVTPAGSELRLWYGIARARPTAVASDDALDASYGVDLYWNGQDFAEDAQGDLATVSGRENVHAALNRRLTSDGLPWNEGYGAKPREYVDGSPLMAQQLRGAIASQAVRDDRVKRASCVVLPESETHPEQTTIETTVTLVDGTALNVQNEVRTQ